MHIYIFIDIGIHICVYIYTHTHTHICTHTHMYTNMYIYRSKRPSTPPLRARRSAPPIKRSMRASSPPRVVRRSSPPPDSTDSSAAAPRPRRTRARRRSGGSPFCSRSSRGRPTCALAFTGYCFTLKLYCGSQSSFHCPPPLLQSLSYCNTIARPMRNMQPPTAPLLYAIHHTILAIAISCKGRRVRGPGALQTIMFMSS